MVEHLLIELTFTGPLISFDAEFVSYIRVVSVSMDNWMRLRQENRNYLPKSVHSMDAHLHKFVSHIWSTKLSRQIQVKVMNFRSVQIFPHNGNREMENKNTEMTQKYSRKCHTYDTSRIDTKIVCFFLFMYNSQLISWIFVHTWVL